MWLGLYTAWLYIIQKNLSEQRIPEEQITETVCTQTTALLNLGVCLVLCNSDVVRVINFSFVRFCIRWRHQYPLWVHVLHVSLVSAETPLWSDARKGDEQGSTGLYRGFLFLFRSLLPGSFPPPFLSGTFISLWALKLLASLLLFILLLFSLMAPCFLPYLPLLFRLSVPSPSLPSQTHQ